MRRAREGEEGEKGEEGQEGQVEEVSWNCGFALRDFTDQYRKGCSLRSFSLALAPIHVADALPFR